MLAKCGFGSMTDVKAWGSEQASFQKAPQQINVFHEGKPAHQNTNVANNEQKRTSMSSLSPPLASLCRFVLIPCSF